jgi:hypothetical protein
MYPREYFETQFAADNPLADWPHGFAIITAHATTGQAWPAAENQAADQKLKEEIEAAGHWHSRVTGFSPRSGHSEPGWAIEIPIDQACDLGLHYQQDAIYYVDDDRLYVIGCEPSRRKPARVSDSFRQRLTKARAPDAPA